MRYLPPQGASAPRSSTHGLDAAIAVAHPLPPHLTLETGWLLRRHRFRKTLEMTSPEQAEPSARPEMMTFGLMTYAIVVSAAVLALLSTFLKIL